MTVIDLKYLLKALILPPGGLVLLGSLGLLAWRRRPRLALTCCAASLTGFWLLATPVVADALGRAVERYPAFDPTHLTPAQARAQVIVILAGGLRYRAPEFGGDAPSTAAVLRLVEGAKIARATHWPILLSGSAAEVLAMRRFMEEDLRLPVAFMEGSSRDTRENAQFTARLLRARGMSRIVLVTTATHLGRAVTEFAATGLEVNPAPAQMTTREFPGWRAYLPAADAMQRSYYALYEWGGDLVQRVPHSPAKELRDEG